MMKNLNDFLKLAVGLILLGIAIGFGISTVGLGETLALTVCCTGLGIMNVIKRHKDNDKEKQCKD